MTIRAYAECAGCDHREVAPSITEYPGTWTSVAEPGKEPVWYCSRGCELRHLAAEHSTPFTPYGLTSLEIQILEQVASGFSIKEVAARLGRTEATLKNALSLVYAKLNARDRVQALLMAHAVGAIDLSNLSREFYHRQPAQNSVSRSIPIHSKHG
jgi:DNA-binding CsgD family transcriptional regulator